MNQIRIPKSFQLFAQTIKVEFDPDLVFDSDARGMAAYRENLIKILSKDNQKRPDEQIEKSFYHELVHWILHLMSEHELSDNEKFVDTFALLLHQFYKTAKYNGFAEPLAHQQTKYFTFNSDGTDPVFK